MATGMGRANYGKGGNYYKNFRLVTNKDGSRSDNIFRILPPIKSLMESGKWALYYGIHFGYRGRDKADPSKTKTRTFKCIQDKDFRSGIIKTECAECTQIDAKKRVRDEREAQLKAQGVSEEEMRIALAPLNNWLKDHNVDRKWYMNVMDLKGEFGVLQISHKARKQLDARIEELMKMGVDPLDPDQGVFFNFIRTGFGVTVQDVVEVVVERKGLSSEIKLAPLSEELQKKGIEICPDLMHVVTEISREQVGLLVTGSGDPEEVDAVFAMSQRREQSAPPKVYGQSAGVQAVAKALAPVPVLEPEPDEDPSQTSSVYKPKETPPVEPQTTPPAAAAAIPEDDEEAAMMARLAQLRAAKAQAAAAAQTTTAPVPAKAPETPAAKPQTVQAVTPAASAIASNEAFLAMFQNPNAKSAA